MANGDKYNNYQELQENHVHGEDYRISVSQGSGYEIAVIAPHGGSIERRTSAISRAIAGDDLSLYLFEGLDPDGSFDTLHITSHRFDEPQCLELVSRCQTAITVHGCGGDAEQILLGGLDFDLRHHLTAALLGAGLNVANEGHRYQGTHENNICNRGLSGAGVQIEFTDALRGADSEKIATSIIRRCLLGWGSQSAE